MSAISLKSISGITSITTPAGVDNIFTVHTNDTTERFRVDSNGNQRIAGILTVAQDLDVDGHTNLDNVSIAGVTSTSDNVRILGTNKLQFADNQSLQIYYDNSSYITNNNAGHLFLKTLNGGSDIRLEANDDIFLLTAAGTRNSIICRDYAQVELYYNNTKRLETTNTGVTVTGTVAATSYTGDGSNLTGISAGSIADNRQNTYFGTEAGSQLSGGSGSRYNNTFYGYQAGKSNTGIQNVAFGDITFKDNSSGNNNTALGRGALWQSTTASNNTGVGRITLGNVSTGSNNTAVGAQAGYSGTNDLTTGSNNLLLGYQATASSATVSNEITLGDANINHLRVPGIGVSFSEGGAVIAGIATFTGPVSFGGTATFKVNQKLYFSDGANNTFGSAFIYADNYNLIVENGNGAGSSYFRGNTCNLQGGPSNYTGVRVSGSQGDVQFFHQNGIIGETHSSGEGGIDIKQSLRHFGDTDTLIEFETNQINFDTGGSERLRITSAGHLQLNGGTIYGDDSAAPTFTLQNTSGNNNHCRIVLGSNVGSDNGGIEFWTAGSSAATKKFSIRGNNNYIEVIGTNTLRFDDGKLNINHNSSNAYIRNTTGQLLYRSATHTFENAAGSTEYFRITSQGLLVGGSDSYNNTTLGTNAGDSFTGPGDAKFNTLIGKDAGTAINSGDYNTSVGCFALDAVTSGQSNTAVGYAALSNCTGQNNVGLGDLAGQGLTSSTGVVAIGEQTLNGSSSSNYMVAIGYQALYTSGTVANTIAIGFRAAYNNTSGSTNQIIGRNAAKGTGSWTGDYNTIIGDEACVDCSGSFNNCMAIGRLALKKVQSSSTTMNSLIAIGNQALQEHDGSGNHSTGGYTMAIGHSALQNMRHIRHCTIVGSNAAYQWNPTSAQQSIHEGGITALGAQAMYNHRSGGSNIAIGRDCNKGPNNSSAGTGNNNISIGTRAAELMTSGAKNISIGDLAGFRIETGYGNVQIGWLANYAYDTTNSTTNGYENTLVGGYTRTLGYNTYKECILGYGAVGKGTRRFFVNCDNGVYHGGNTSSWDTTSDERIKKNIVDNIIGLDKIEKIKVKNFEYRTKDELTDFPENMRDSVVVDKEGTQLGVIAQEINEILPDVVDKNEDGNGAWTVNPDNITWYLVNAVKELSAEVKALKAQINS